MRVVEWEESARDELADVWVQAAAAERPAIEQAVVSIERELADNAEQVGESRFDRVKIETRPPLTVWFEVRDPYRVRIFHVHCPRR